MKMMGVKTDSKARVVQVIRYQDNKRIVLYHIGMAHTGEALNDLMIMAEEWIKDNASQLSIYPDENPNCAIHLNEALIGKTQELLGIKGYYTNLETSEAVNKTIMERHKKRKYDIDRCYSKQ
jgi:hypothetical protein